MVKIKICGMRRRQDIEYVNRYRPDYAGFILSEGFKRSIVFGTFCELDTYLDREIKRVGVFVNEPIENVLRYYPEMLDVIQLHGDEDAEYIKKLRENFSGEIWKAVRASSAEDIKKAETLCCDRLLIDSYVKGQVGGTGKTADLDVIIKASPKSGFFLAGGLNCENVSEAVRKVDPYGVDLSSSVETDGFKDENKIREIIEMIRRI